MPTYLSPGVYIEEVPAGTRPIEGVGTAIAGFVGFAPTGPLNEATLVTNWIQYVATFGDMVEEFALGKAVYGFFNNGGGRAYIVRLPASGDGTSASPGLPVGQLALAGGGKGAGTPAFQVRALDANAGAISVDVEPAAGAAPDSGTYDVTVSSDSGAKETFTGVTAGPGAKNIAELINTGSRLIEIEELDVAAADLAAGLSTGTVALSIPSGTVVPTVPTAEVIGDAAQRTGFAAFEALEEITMVLAPDLVVAHRQGLIDTQGVVAVQNAMVSHCELMGNRMAILDTPAGLTAQQASDWRETTTNFDSKFAVLYWPWIEVFDPSVGHDMLFPPSGHVAGLWSRNDNTRGVFKAPANDVLQGAVGLELNVTRGEMDMLNPEGVNSIKSFPGRGIRVWGARTLSSDAEWRYINVRRYFNYLEESILQGTQWCVFEPNDARLWGTITRTINAFLVNEWRTGALFGAKPEQAFFVKCDGQNNTAETIDAGMVIIEIGVAPVKPAEFVIFRLSQFSGGASVSD
ncbi:MAG: phage tail sheath family protein [Actinomycetota bacterium]